MADRFDAIAEGVVQKGAEVGGVIVAQPGGAVVLAAVGEPDAVEFGDLLAGGALKH